MSVVSLGYLVVESTDLDRWRHFASDLMGFMVKDQHIDPDLFKLFLASGVYKQYAERFLLPDQIDDVDLKPYLGQAA